MNNKIDQLLEKQSQIEARLSLLKAREKEKQRKLLTRKKIIIGGSLLKLCDNDQEPSSPHMRTFRFLLSTLSERDRRLFGL